MTTEMKEVSNNGIYNEFTSVGNDLQELEVDTWSALDGLTEGRSYVVETIVKGDKMSNEDLYLARPDGKAKKMAFIIRVIVFNTKQDRINWLNRMYTKVNEYFYCWSKMTIYKNGSQYCVPFRQFETPQ